MKIATKIIMYSFWGLLLVCGLIGFISDLTSMGTFIDSFHYIDVLWYVPIAYILDLLFNIFLLVFASLNAVSIYYIADENKKKFSQEKIISNGLLTLIVYLGLNILTAVLVIINGYTVAGSQFTINASSIVCIVFGIIGIVAYIIALNKKEEDKPSLVFSAIGYGVTALFLFVSMSMSSGIVIAIEVFLLFALIAAAMELIDRKIDFTSLIKKEAKEEVKSDKESSQSNSETVIEKLNKLKELYDQGILTEEEYSQKRKEIIDSLKI